MKVSESGYTKEELLEIVDTYLAEQSRRWDFIEEKGDGMYVYAENGDRYLDFFAGIAVSSAGNANKKVAKAIADQAANVIHASNYAYTLPMILLAKKVCDTIGMEKIVFQNSGTEANEAMIKMARKYGVDHYGPEHYKIVTAKNSFHGRTYGALSATGQPDSACHKGFAPLLPGFTYAEYNNLEDFKSKCDENTIGIMVEPVQGEGGVYPADPEFLKGLREFCDEKKILLMFDEVQTGWGRTGEIMAYMTYGVKPDMVSMAKAIGGGMPIGAMCTSAEIAKVFTPGAHGSTLLEKICRERGSKKKNLEAMLKEMVSKNILPETLDQCGFLIRKLGNSGAHGDDDIDLSQSDVAELLDFIETILYYIYELPVKIARINSKYNLKLDNRSASQERGEDII